MEKSLLTRRALVREFTLVSLQMIMHCVLVLFRNATVLADIETGIILLIRIDHLY